MTENIQHLSTGNNHKNYRGCCFCSELLAFFYLFVFVGSFDSCFLFTCLSFLVEFTYILWASIEINIIGISTSQQNEVFIYFDEVIH